MVAISAGRDELRRNHIKILCHSHERIIDTVPLARTNYAIVIPTPGQPSAPLDNLDRKHSNVYTLGEYIRHIYVLQMAVAISDH